MSSPSREELIPWSWTITPLASSNRQCPPPSIILGTFAGVNVVATILGVILGSRKVSRRILRILTCSCWGNDDIEQSQEWKYMWIFPLGLNLGANAFNAWITLNAAGYDRANNPKLWDLMFFYTTRPRIGWIALSFLSVYGAESGKDGLWTSAGRQAAIAEAMMQAIGTYYMGRTANWATSHGYYLAHHTDFQHGLGVRLMIAGALLSLLLTWLSVFLLISYGVSLHKFLKGGKLSFHKYLESGGNSADRVCFRYYPIFLTFMYGFAPWIGSWLFMAGYVKLAGNLYCPPRFLAQGVVWTGFSAIGSFLGGGV